MDRKKNIISLMKSISYRHDLWTVYSDFLELSAIAISNSVDTLNRQVREKRYMEIINKYSKEEADIFPKILGELVMKLEEAPTDVLGEIFMELELGSKWNGQFFTPMSICRASGEMMVVDMKDKIKKLGYITVCEPAVGGGAMVIGLAQAMKDAGLNYQHQMLVTAVDLDIKAVHMAYIQLSLLGIPAVVCHGNTLTVETYSNWYTPVYVIDGWMFRKQKNIKEVINLQPEDNFKFKKLRTKESNYIPPIAVNKK